ncbi:unnamed protein product [Candidula unifasciata]|uniref:Uncharacterized protein n=1 Tax=Candidula unifasciata TaxID=100452 RepID=A0A8S3YY72_9EUPU|nr:unnamed protein product [Candidula unifasciata]
MPSSVHQPECWRVANPCPYIETSSGRKLSCQAWFRCEMAGNYIIRWRCQTSEEAEFSFNGTTLSLCHNQSDSIQLTECPPPVVCAEDHHKSYSTVRTGMSTEIAIVIALAAFAFLAVIMIVVSSYKYWSLRRRQPQRNNPGHYFPFPTHYHNFWGAGFHQRHHGNRTLHPSRPQGNQYPDVYFSQPQESWRYFEHVLTSSDDSIGKNTKKHCGKGQTNSKKDRLKVDPSVVTESFIYHQPARVNSLDEFSEGNQSWLYQNKRASRENDDLEESMECYHIYKGNLSRFRSHEENYTNRHAANYRNEYRYQITSSADFIRAPQLSSIPIPGFSLNGFQETSHQKKLDVGAHGRERNRQHQLLQRKIDSDSSYESIHGRVTKTSNTHQHNMVTSEIHHSNHYYQAMTPNSVNVQSGVMTPGGVKVHSGALTPTHGTSPDVINSHNFTNRFVRVGKNIYRPVLTRSPSGSSISINSSNNNNNHHYVDLSYDSFLNEHLKELAKRGAASSSTLEARQQKKKKDSDNRY